MSRFLPRHLYRQSSYNNVKLLHTTPRRSLLIQFYTKTYFRQKCKIEYSQVRNKHQIAKSPPPHNVVHTAPKIRDAKVFSNPTFYQTYAVTLAQKPHSTLLYTAPSSSAYYISSYATASLCFGYGILSYWNNYLYAPPDIAIWIPYAFTGVSLITILFGIRFLCNPLRMIRNMTAIPKIEQGKQILEIEIELKKMIPLPFFAPKVICVAPKEIFIPSLLVSQNNPHISQLEQRRQRAQEILQRQQDLEYERSHIMSAGIRHLWRAISKVCTGIFRATQRAFTRDNFFEMRIRGKIYKLDLDGGWVLDNGKAIDRLVTLEPS
ncbi:hypothetical protein HI914_05418 [Erysiphe necator]|uniref:Uncharacterized protein n=1 Tax=Uncinula necator TaxID=52586 RepID=A0A0B1P3I9_UNCNE|nr:hypothetical protein HI914_05418 [Erysiphe necator]KHJ32813.1 hypothetical protein EV44_g3032 [Erysiphe necator]